GKTGTTEDYGNAWFIGFVPQLATAVWVGRPEGDIPMKEVDGVDAVTGGTFPARIFGAYMQVVVRDLPIEQIYTASPDELALHPLMPPTTVSVPGAPGAPGAPPPTAPPASTTTESTTTTTTTRGPRSSTTTSTSGATTTTAAARGG